MLRCDWLEKSPHRTTDDGLTLDGDTRRHSPDTTNTVKLFGIPLPLTVLECCLILPRGRC